MFVRSIISGISAMVLLLAATPVSLAQTQDKKGGALPPGVVATIDGQPVTDEEFSLALTRGARQAFYHGQVKEDRLQELKVKTIEEVIDRRLLLKEAEKRGVKPDTADVERKIASYEEQYKNSEEWKAKRSDVLPPLREQMLQNSRLKMLEESIRKVSDPSEKELANFYKDHPESFTEPARDHVSVILLGVDPSSTKEVWQAAKAEAAKIREKIQAGAKFEDLAKLHSADESAPRGGDMGYVHRGMLSSSAQEAVDAIKVGELTPPVELLQGYAVFKLVERKPAVLRELKDVRERAIDLYRRNTAESRWNELKGQLRKKAKVVLHPDLTAAAAPKGGAEPAKK
jgi:parvulin-like peptidyl-prolyl isomerase